MTLAACAVSEALLRPQNSLARPRKSYGAEAGRIVRCFHARRGALSYRTGAICSKKMILSGPAAWAVRFFGEGQQRLFGRSRRKEPYDASRKPISSSARGELPSYAGNARRRFAANRRVGSFASVTSIILPRQSNYSAQGPSWGVDEGSLNAVTFCEALLTEGGANTRAIDARPSPHR